LDTLVGITHAPCSVEPWRQSIADGPLADPCVVCVDLLQQGGHSATSSFAEHVEPEVYEDPILVDEGHHVGHGAEADQIEIVDEVWSPAFWPDTQLFEVGLQGKDEVERHADCGEIDEWKAATWHPRVED